MKKIFIVIITVLISAFVFAQDPDTVTIQEDSLLYATDFVFVDSIDYEPVVNNNWYYSDFENFENGDTLTQIQYRISDEGIQEKRTIVYLKVQKTKVKFDYYSKLKTKKDKKDK